jgi:hypothetical protein
MDAAAGAGGVGAASGLAAGVSFTCVALAPAARRRARIEVMGPAMLAPPFSWNVKPGIVGEGVLGSTTAYFPVLKVPGTTTCQPSLSRTSDIREGSTKMFID